MREEKVYELICKTEKVIDNLAGNLVISAAEQEKYRAELISLLDKEERRKIGSLERSYFYFGPPKLLYIKIPSLPLSLNRTISMRNNFVNGKNVQGSLIEWWDIKIKNALDNMQLADEEFSFEAFAKAVAVIKFTFSSDILRDIDNFAIKYIIDALEKNKVIVDDNKDVLKSMMPILATGDEQGIEVFVTDDGSLLEMIHFFYNKYKGTFERLEEMKKNPLSPEDFFDLR